MAKVGETESSRCHSDGEHIVAYNNKKERRFNAYNGPEASDIYQLIEQLELTQSLRVLLADWPKGKGV